MSADSIRAERQFAKNASFRYMRLQCERWLSAMVAAGQLDQLPPTLYPAYVCGGGPALASTRMRPVSDFFEQLDRPNARLEASASELAAKNAVIRLLAVCVKAHHFLFKLDVLEEAPSIFWVPDLMNPTRPRFGIYYPFLRNKRAIVASEADLALVSSGQLALGRFPVVLTHRPDRWLDLAHWERLEQEGSALRALLEDPKRAGAPASAAQPDGAFPFGSLFEVPEELRPLMKAAGLRWSEGARSYYLPRGFDLDPVSEYFEHLRRSLDAARDISTGSVESFLEETR
jgi:hypothetical protein